MAEQFNPAEFQAYKDQFDPEEFKRFKSDMPMVKEAAPEQPSLLWQAAKQLALPVTAPLAEAWEGTKQAFPELGAFGAEVPSGPPPQATGFTKWLQQSEQLPPAFREGAKRLYPQPTASQDVAARMGGVSRVMAAPFRAFGEPVKQAWQAWSPYVPWQKVPYGSQIQD